MTAIALRLPKVRVPRPVLKFLATVKPAFLVRREADRLIRRPDPNLYMDETAECLKFYRIVLPVCTPLPTFASLCRTSLPVLAHCIQKRKLTPGQAEALRRAYGRVN